MEENDSPDKWGSSNRSSDETAAPKEFAKEDL